MSTFEDWISKKEERRSRKNDRKQGIRVYTKPRGKRIRSKARTGFSEDVRAQARDRAGNICENPLCGNGLAGVQGGEHHCLPRSQYKKADRNDLWNCAAICERCHAEITSPRTDDDKRLRRYFERLAVIRRELSGDQLEREERDLDNRLRAGEIELFKSF